MSGDRGRPGLFDLSGKVAAVTGGAGLIGSRVCHGLAAHGAAVAVVDIRDAAARALATEIERDHGVKSLAVACDVAAPDSVDAMIATVGAHFGRLDVVHNNAATRGKSRADFYAAPEDFKIETWREIMAVNLDGLFLVAKAAGRRMIEQGFGGSIIQTGSIYGLVAPDPRIYEGSDDGGHRMNTPPAYAASKAAAVGLTRYLAAYWAPRGIRVNCLVPGGVESNQNETFRAAYRARTPLGRMASADDMVGAVVYLASEASRYVTGQTIVVDGGWTAW